VLGVEAGSVAADSFEIVTISSNSLVASAGNPTSPIVTTNANEISDDAWTNTSSSPVQVIYKVAPWTGGCRGDEVDIIVTIDPAPVVSVDENATICSSETVDLTAISATISGGSSSGSWSSSGTGSFAEGSGEPSTAFGGATTYTPSEADIEAGTVTLTLSSSDPDGVCSSDSDSITIEILDITCSEFPWNGGE